MPETYRSKREQVSKYVSELEDKVFMLEEMISDRNKEILEMKERIRDLEHVYND